MNISAEAVSPEPARGRGLSETEAMARLSAEGPNEIARQGRRTMFGILLEVLREPMLALLLAGGIVYLALGDLQEALILIALLIAHGLWERAPDPRARTAVVLVNGYNGLGLHTALHVPRMFGDTFRNFAFLSVGSVDAGTFKGATEIASLRAHTMAEAERYVRWARAHGFGATAFTAVGHDTTGELMQLAASAREQFPNSVFFAGQLLFAHDTRLNRLLHNHTAFTLQRRFFLANLPFVVLPIRVAN